MIPEFNRFTCFTCIIFFVELFIFGQTNAQDKIVIGPDYNIDLRLTDLGNPKGKVFEFSMRLAESRIFPGTDSTLDLQKPVRKERRIFVYIPAAYKDGTKAPILVTFDGPSHFKEVCNALDNLTISKKQERKLPAFVLIERIPRGFASGYRGKFENL